MSPIAWSGRRGPLRRPVARSVLRRPWKDVEYCVVDLETTASTLVGDQVVSYGAVLVRDGRVLARTATYALVRPTRPVPPSTIRVHGLRAQDLDGAAPMSSCFDTLDAMLAGRVLVAHAAWIESGFLDRAFRAQNARLRVPIVDTAALARAAGVVTSAGAHEPSLEWLAAKLGLPVHTPHHALGDAMTTAGLLLALATRLDDGPTPLAAGQLVSLTRQYRLSST